MEPWTTHLYALLPNFEQASLLMIDVASGPALPHAVINEQIDLSQAGRVTAGLSPACGLPVNVLRCLVFENYPAESRSEALYLCEARPEGLSSGGLPAGRRWVPLKKLSPDSLVPPALLDSLTDGLEEIKEQQALGPAWQPPPLRAHWALPGWHAQVEAWITEEIARLGLSILAIEPLKSWGISVVMRVRAGSRLFFFKASRDLPLFVNEGKVMTALARLYPENVPAPLAVESEKGWMLLEDFGNPLGREAPLALQARMFQEMANMQIRSAAQIDLLLRAGCIDRRLPWVQARLDAFLEDEPSFSRVTAADRETLRRALPRLHVLLAELESLSVPPALVHGDLHAGNVSLREAHLLFFDWTDAAVAHPFFDIYDVFVSSDPLERETLEAAYRAPWEAIYPAGQVRRAMELARVVFGLYHAISYQFLLNNIEEADRPGLNSVNFFLRQVLSGLEALG